MLSLDPLAAERELEKDRIEYQQVATEEDRALEEKSSAQHQLAEVDYSIKDTGIKLDEARMQSEGFRSDNALAVQEMNRLQKQAHDALQEKESLEKRIREYEKANNAQALKKLEHQHDAVARRNQSLVDQMRKLKDQASASEKKAKDMQAVTARYQADLKKFQCDRGRLQKELNDKEKQHRDAVRKKEIVFQQSQRRMAMEHRTLSKKAEQERQRRVLVERKFEALKGKNEMFVNMQKRRVDGRQAKQRGRMPQRGPPNQKDRSSSCVITGVGIGNKESLNFSIGSAMGGTFGSALNATMPNSMGGEAAKMRLPSNPNDKDEVLTFMRQTFTREMKREDDAEQVQKYQSQCNDLRDEVVEQRKRVNLLEQNELYATVPEDKHAYRCEKEQAAMKLISLTDQLEHTRSLLRLAADEHVQLEKKRREQTCQTAFERLQDYCEANMDVMAPMLLEEMLNFKKNERKMEGELVKLQESVEMKDTNRENRVVDESTAASSAIVMEKDKQIAELKQRLSEAQARLSVENSIVQEPSQVPSEGMHIPVQPQFAAQEELRQRQSSDESMMDVEPERPPRTPALDMNAVRQSSASASGYNITSGSSLNVSATTDTGRNSYIAEPQDLDKEIAPATQRVMTYREAREQHLLRKQASQELQQEQEAQEEQLAQANAFLSNPFDAGNSGSGFDASNTFHSADSNSLSHSQFQSQSQGGLSIDTNQDLTNMNGQFNSQAGVGMSASDSTPQGSAAGGSSFVNRMQNDTAARRERRDVQKEGQTHAEAAAEFNNNLRSAQQTPTNQRSTASEEREENMSAAGGIYQTRSDAPWSMRCTHRVQINPADKAVFSSHYDMAGIYRNRLFAGCWGVFQEWDIQTFQQIQHVRFLKISTFALLNHCDTRFLR